MKYSQNITKREAAAKLRVIARAMRYDFDQVADNRADELDTIADALDPQGSDAYLIKIKKEISK